MGALNIHNEELIYAVFDKVTIKNENIALSIEEEKRM